MTGFKSKKAAALDEEGMYLVHQTAQPAQEPVEDVMLYHDDGTYIVRIAPQRTWVDLTDEEIDKWTPEIHGVIREVIAQFKEKNNA